MIAIIDYGMGNLRSVEKALQKLGHAALITSDAEEVRQAERVILPGVGAFGAAMANLEQAVSGAEPLTAAVRQAVASGKPFLGICLGMQLLLTESDEMGLYRGLDIIPGRVERFDFPDDPTLKIPHMGWNGLHFPDERSPLFAGLEEGTQVYFVHSYVCWPTDSSVIAATCTHGEPFCAALASGNVYAVQFHPEKSGHAGLQILENFAGL